MIPVRVIAIAVATLCIALCSGDQPSYQVSLFVKLHPKGPPIHLCNGAIIQSRLVMTTASCLHYRFPSRKIIYVLEPHMLHVVIGSNTEFTDELMLGVANITLVNNFNFTTNENDLAILRLSDKLPLNSRNDISWITLEDVGRFEGPCLGNFYVRNTLSNAPSYTQSEELPLLESKVCREDSLYPLARENDICSFYMLPLEFNCQDVDTILLYNGDRGTGLVCENRLVGLLSTVLPKDHEGEMDCSDEPIKAFYTSLAPHSEWIYTVIGEEDLDMYEHGEYISSLPYAGENNAMAEADIPEPGLTSLLVASQDLNSTEALTTAITAISGAVSGKILFSAATIWMSVLSIFYY